MYQISIYCLIVSNLNVHVKINFRFFIYWTGSSASWVISFMSIERFLAIYFPFKIKILTSTKKVMVAMVITLTSTAILNLHFFWTYENKERRTGKSCSVVSKYKLFLIEYWPWITLTFYSLIPLIILIVTSSAIIRKIVRSNYERRHNMNYKEGVKMTSMTLTLFCVSFVFMIATGPVVIYRYGIQ